MNLYGITLPKVTVGVYTRFTERPLFSVMQLSKGGARL